MPNSEIFDSTIYESNEAMGLTSPEEIIPTDQVITFKRAQDLSMNCSQDQQHNHTPLHDSLTSTSRDQSSPFISHPGSPVDGIIPRFSSSPSETVRGSYTTEQPLDDVLNLQTGISQLCLQKDGHTENPTSIDGSEEEVSTINSLSPRKSKATRNPSVWRHMRPSSIYSSQPKSLFHDDPNLEHGESVNIKSTNTTSREEYLNKEIIELKIKYVKLREFLMDLLDSTGNNPSKIREYLNCNEGKLKSELEMKLEELQLQYDEAMKLNSDLHSNLSTFESKLKEKEISIEQLHSYIDSVNVTIDDFIKTLMDEGAIGTPLDHSYIFPTLEEKLEALKSQILTRIDGENNNNIQIVPPTPSSLLSSNQHSNHSHPQQIQESMDTIHQLLMRINNLESYHQNEREHLKSELSIHRAEASRIKKTFEIMTSKFNELKNVIDKKESHLSQQSGQIGEYKQVISGLQNEIQLLKQSPSSRPPLDASPSETSNRISDLSSKLQHKSIALRQQLDVSENLKIQLENSLQKERSLRTDRIRLSSTTEQLKKENDELKSKMDEATNNLDSIKKKISTLEFQYKELLLFDTNEFKKLIQSYDKIADDRSLMDSKTKYEKLCGIINDMKSVDYNNQQSHLEYKNIHNSIFEFFVRATDILINDHVSLLLKENDNQEIKKLKAQVEKLREENESLQDELSKHEFGLEEDSLSPISKLRTSVLTKKWKAERERRILEDSEAKKRFHEMEMEIQKLKELNSNRSIED
ncbi:hypothetical protein K4I79_003013 [Candida tropicalis]